jgi:hypothetical protein
MDFSIQLSIEHALEIGADLFAVRPALVNLAWRGYEKGGFRIGPIQGQMDKYFRPWTQTDTKANLIRLGILIESYRHPTSQLAKNTLLVSEVATSKANAIQEFQVLKSLRTLNYSQVDEVNAMFEILDQPLTLMTPERIEGSMLSGTSEEQMTSLLTQESFSYRKKVSRLSERYLTEPIKTPVDQVISELTILNATTAK